MPTRNRLEDRNGCPLESGDSVVFHSCRGTPMKAVVGAGKLLGTMTEVVIGQDPFPTMVDRKQLSASAATRRKNDMPRSAPAEAPTAKELRRQAKTLRIEGWEEMTRDQLAEAIAEHSDDDAEPAAAPRKAARTAKKSSKSTTKRTSRTTRERGETAPPRKSTRKATKSTSKRTARKAAKATTKRTGAPRPPRDPESPNPYRPGTNRWHYAESLIKGGKRSTQIRQLRSKVKFSKRKTDNPNFDFDSAVDGLLQTVSYDLCRENDFTRELVGRGADATLQVFPPE